MSYKSSVAVGRLRADGTKWDGVRRKASNEYGRMKQFTCHFDVMLCGDVCM